MNDTSHNTPADARTHDVGAGRDNAARQSVTCPFCRSTDTELLSLFGAQLSTVQYYCRACRTPFEYMKQDDE